MGTDDKEQVTFELLLELHFYFVNICKVTTVAFNSSRNCNLNDIIRRSIHKSFSKGFKRFFFSYKCIVSFYLSGSDQIRSVAQSCLTLCDPMNRSTPGLPVHYQLPESTQTHVHRVSDAIQPSHPLLSPSPLAPNPSHLSGGGL